MLSLGACAPLRRLMRLMWSQGAVGEQPRRLGRHHPQTYHLFSHVVSSSEVPSYKIQWSIILTMVGVEAE